MAKKRARRKNTALKKYLGRIRGNTGILLILLVVIFGGVFLAGGIFPKVTEESFDKTQALVPDETTFTPGGGKDTLKLQTLKFKKCSQTTAVSMMLDVTGSMNDEGKIGKLKSAVLSFTNNMSDDSVIGIQTFSSSGRFEVVPISLYKDVKSDIQSKIPNLIAGGGTPTYEGLVFARDKLQTALPQFPNRKFAFIFVSDGQPDPSSQDPRLFNPNPADEIKNLGVNVFTIAIFDSQQQSNPNLSELMRSIASSPDNLYIAPTADQLASIYQQIGTKICGSTQ